MPLLLELRLPLSLHVLIVTLHFVFVFLDFLQVILINMVLVRLRIPFYQETAVVFVGGTTRLLTYIPLLLFINELILPDERRRLLWRVSKLNLIYFREDVLRCFVYTESLLLINVRDWLLLCLLSLDDEILKLLFLLRLALFRRRSQLPLLFN